MKKRQAAIDESYEAQWDGGKGSHHPDYDPTADGSDVKKASRETEELLMAVIKVRWDSRGRSSGGQGRALLTPSPTRHATHDAERHPPRIQEDRGGS